MDPVSQGAIGAAFAKAGASDKSIRAKYISIAWLGCAAGMAPDLDVFIASPTDPLLFLEFHRHFTHALIFIPIGAAIVCGALYWFARKHLSWREAYLACLFGYATHGLLDACTSYGTQLFWPFSDTRVAWNNVSVVDPLFTIPLVTLVVLAARRHKPVFSYVAVGWVVLYLGIGAIQLYRAEAATTQLAQSRGHEPLRLTMKPSFGNLIVWKSIYEHEGNYYVDGIRTGADVSWCSGDVAPKLNIARDLPEWRQGSQQATDLERFRWFSQDYLAPTGEPGGVTDVRYSVVPNEIEPMWGITLSSNVTQDTHVDWWASRDTSARVWNKLGSLISGSACAPVPR